MSILNSPSVLRHTHLVVLLFEAKRHGFNQQISSAVKRESRSRDWDSKREVFNVWHRLGLDFSHLSEVAFGRWRLFQDLWPTGTTDAER